MSSEDNKMTTYYWFEPADGRLEHGDGRVPEVGVTHTVDVEPVPCVAGLAAFLRPLDALRYAASQAGYAASQAVWAVRLGGVIVHSPSRNQSAATERTYVRRIEVDLRQFARECALDVIDLWDAPQVCRRYLRTGDDSLRVAAGDAARVAAGDAHRNTDWGPAGDTIRDPAWDAAWAATAAMRAARSAAWSAARGAARAAAWAAARAGGLATAKDLQNRRLWEMIWRGGRP
jgi:hypothetical protein